MRSSLVDCTSASSTSNSVTETGAVLVTLRDPRVDATTQFFTMPAAELRRWRPSHQSENERANSIDEVQIGADEVNHRDEQLIGGHRLVVARPHPHGGAGKSG